MFENQCRLRREALKRVKRGRFEGHPIALPIRRQNTDRLILNDEGMMAKTRDRNDLI